MRRLSALWLDVSPLRDSAHYRRLWFGDLVASSGSQFAAVALPYQVYSATHSSFAVGMVGLTALVPLLLGALAAGAIADAFDRRRVLVASHATSAPRGHVSRKAPRCPRPCSVPLDARGAGS